MTLRKTNLAWKASQATPVRQMVLQIKPVPPRHPFYGLIYFHLRPSRLAAEGHLS